MENMNVDLKNKILSSGKFTTKCRFCKAIIHIEINKPEDWDEVKCPNDCQPKKEILK